jgi:hypothetical protein
MRWIEIKIAGDVRWISPRVNAPLESFKFDTVLRESML